MSEVLMPRARNIKPGFFTNEVLAELPPLTRLLFIGLWTEADREGRLEDRPNRLRLRLFPLDDFNIEESLEQLSRKGFISRYLADGFCVIQILAWHKHQRPHFKEAPSTLPPEVPLSTNLGSGEHQPRLVLAPTLVGAGTNLGSGQHRLIPDTGYRIPDAGFSGDPSLIEQQPEPPKAAATARQPEIDWSDPDPGQLIAAKLNEWAEVWMEPGNIPRAKLTAEREFVKSNEPIVQWLGKIQVSFDRWQQFHAEKRFRDRKHFIPHLERWFYDGDYSRRPPGQGLAVVAAQQPVCGVCGDSGMVYPDAPPELFGEARLDWLASRGESCSACGGAA
jgi:hypothetical protein